MKHIQNQRFSKESADHKLYISSVEEGGEGTIWIKLTVLKLSYLGQCVSLGKRKMEKSSESELA